MDGLTIAAAVVQFIDVACKVVSNTSSIRRSPDGQLDEHREIEEVTNILSRDAQHIRQCIAERRTISPLTAAEKEQEKLGIDCQDVADQLLSALDQLKTDVRGSQWKSLRQALRTMWREDKILSLERRLDRFRQQMVTIILNSLRLQAEKSSRQQTSILDTVNEIKQLQKDTQSLGRAFLKELGDGERWRQDLIQAIHENKQTSQRGAVHAVGRAGLSLDEEDANHIQQLVLRSIRFREMVDREYRIPKAHEKTFKWVLDEESQESSFRTFLKGQDQLYWITGKPGAGKSTLMKYLRQNPKTFECLNAWTRGTVCLFANFYFWNSGSDMQMTVEGLLQTLLHECLKQRPSATRVVFPERWEVFSLIGEDDYPWRWPELSTALRRLVLEVDEQQLKLFMMIDGLDECAGDQSRLTDLILELVGLSSNLKICVASRPWTNFEDCFRTMPHLKVEDLTRGDIAKFVKSKFKGSEGFHELKQREPEYAANLLKEVSEKAQGVFLWVHLVVSSLLAGLTNGDRIRDLQRRLDSLPPRLEDLFQKMLYGLEDGYLAHASQLFQLVRASRISPSLLGLALADLDDRQHVLRAQVKMMPKEEKLVRCKNMQRKLMSRCRGLLEATMHTSADKIATMDDAVLGQESGHSRVLPHVRFGGSGWRSDFDLDEKHRQCPNCNDSMFSLKVQYLHRTVKDYVETPDVWKWIVSANTEAFNPHSNWCESYLAQLKTIDIECLYKTLFWDKVSWCLDSAKRSEKISSKPETRLLDELNRTCTSLVESRVTDGRKVLDIISPGLYFEVQHWTTTLINWEPQASFLYLMAMCGMHRYLDSRMPARDEAIKAPGSAGSMPPTIGNSEDDEAASLLFAATDDFLALGQFVDRQELIQTEPSVETVRVLLEKGEDPYRLLRGRSPWTVAHAMDLRDEGGYKKIARLYRKHCGPPPVYDSSRSGARPSWRDGMGGPAGTPLTWENLARVDGAKKYPEGGQRRGANAEFGDGTVLDPLSTMRKQGYLDDDDSEQVAERRGRRRSSRRSRGFTKLLCFCG